MTRSSPDLRQRAVEYAWRAWCQLGVAGWERAGFAACVDIDALVLLTGSLGDADARLRDESLDWCAQNLAFVSRSRLSHLLRASRAGPGWASYAATLERATKQSWPGAGEPFAWTPSRKSDLPARPAGSRLGLRCRALFGATARGEILRVLLLAERGRAVDARELVEEAGYTKRAVAEALDSLKTAGVVAATPSGNSLRHALRRAEELEALLAPLPTVRWSQRALARILVGVLGLEAELEGASDRVRRVETARLVAELEADVGRVDARAPWLSPDGIEWPELVRWCADRCGEAMG